MRQVSLLICFQAAMVAALPHPARREGEGGWAQDITYRITGGQSVVNVKPWMAGLRYFKNGKWQNYCGATLIAPSWALTAAHCVDKNFILNDHVWVGGKSFDDMSQYQVFGVASYKCHPLWEPFNGLQHDICLLRLNGTSALKPITLNNDMQYEQPGMQAVVSGWGATVEDKGSPNANEVMWVDVPIVDDDECIANYADRYTSPEMLCAGYKEGVKDACYGDSGGPLYIDGQDLQVGIVSWGNGCGEAGFHGVYTRVAHYIDWINSTVDQPLSISGRMVPVPALTDDDNTTSPSPLNATLPATIVETQAQFTAAAIAIQPEPTQSADTPTDLQVELQDEPQPAECRNMCKVYRGTIEQRDTSTTYRVTVKAMPQRRYGYRVYAKKRLLAFYEAPDDTTLSVLRYQGNRLVNTAKVYSYGLGRVRISFCVKKGEYVWDVTAAANIAGEYKLWLMDANELEDCDQ
eukprot:comp17433_c0_seq1/m.16838 comp17433_c0_seq1/g.16838  ORF comp17433_c0_seq1/g.16838 comp17433_c0_seq1/m.16838 type:complete len:463 (-) comp17433_c0_seq1:572-1960(-)